MRRFLVLALIVLAFFRPACSQEITEFQSIDSFLKSLNSGRLIIFAEGDLFSKARIDWTGIITSKAKDNEEISEIYILEKLESGKYRFVAKSAPRPAFSGTGNFGYEDISIANKNVFVVFSYHWHSCAGNSTSQFKLTKNGWQLVGIESFETNSVDGSGLDINTSTNLLTGTAIIKKINKGKSKVSKVKTQPKLILLKDYSGEGTISIHEQGSIC